MKIQSSNDWLERVRPDQPKSALTPAPGGFGDFLKTSLGQASAAAEAAGPGAALTVQFLPQGPLPSDSLAARLEGLLDLMDEYRSRLADPRVSLKALDPQVCALERQRETLVPLLGSLQEDRELKDIFNQALVATEVEIMRFRRGDYLPA
jgi:hypothetical protein